jgi:hypothetical protein
MMNDSSCPVLMAITEIRGGGLYGDDAELTDARVVRLGGHSGKEYVMDNAPFYIMSRKIELARFELTRPDLQSCARKYKFMFGFMEGQTNGSVYNKLIENILGKRFMYEQYIQLVDLLGQLDDLILAKVLYMSNKGTPINISLPDIFMSPHVNQVILYRPDVLERSINDMIDYVNKININSLLSKPMNIHISHVKKIDAVCPDMNAKIHTDSHTQSHIDTPEQYIAEMKRLLAIEIDIAMYISAIEKYHSDVINHVNKIYDACGQMVDDLRNISR